MNVRKLLKVFGRKHAVLPGPAGRDLPKREGELRGRVGPRDEVKLRGVESSLMKLGEEGG